MREAQLRGRWVPLRERRRTHSLLRTLPSPPTPLPLHSYRSELASLRLEKTKLEAALAPGTAGKEGNLRSRTAPAAGGLMLPQAPGTWGSTPQRPATAR